jgi:hypothetical protein
MLAALYSMSLAMYGNIRDVVLNGLMVYVYAIYDVPNVLFSVW